MRTRIQGEIDREGSASGKLSGCFFDAFPGSFPGASFKDFRAGGCQEDSCLSPPSLRARVCLPGASGNIPSRFFQRFSGGVFREASRPPLGRLSGRLPGIFPAASFSDFRVGFPGNFPGISFENFRAASQKLFRSFLKHFRAGGFREASRPLLCRLSRKLPGSFTGLFFEIFSGGGFLEAAQPLL